MKLLVTGGAGRLGSVLIKSISSQGYNVVVFDLPFAPWEAVQDVPNIKIIRGDVTDPSHISRACRGIDGVFHLASLLPPKSEADEKLTMKVNVEGTRNLIEVLKKRPGTPLVFASSISTYGLTSKEEPPIGEDHHQNAHNIYAKSKIEAERIIQVSEIPHVVLRIAPIAIADLVELPDIVPYKADQRVEFIYVEDAARALFSAAINKKALGRIFNIAGGPSWQMTGLEFLEGFYGALGLEVELNFSDEYTALDWYDTSNSQFLDYQRTSFKDFQRKLGSVAEELGLI